MEENHKQVFQGNSVLCSQRKSKIKQNFKREFQKYFYFEKSQ